MNIETRWRVLSVCIHTAHGLWMAMLIPSIDASGAVATYFRFLPFLVLASTLEMSRWAFLGKEQIDIKGAYSMATAINTVNRDFLLLSWYVVPPIPPRSIVDSYSQQDREFPLHTHRHQVFATFWLGSEVTRLLIAGTLFLVLFLEPTSGPNLWGLGKFHPIACVFWIIELGLLSKLLSILIFSIAVCIRKGC